MPAGRPMPPKRSAKRPNPTDVIVGRNVRFWRMSKGLSQAELAKKLGVTFQQLQKYEIGGNRIPTGRLVKAAAVLGVPISALFAGTDAIEASQALLALVTD